MRTKKELELELKLEKANQRIEDLEFTICKGTHDYRLIEQTVIGLDPSGFRDLTEDVFRCARCGKKKII